MKLILPLLLLVCAPFAGLVIAIPALFALRQHSNKIRTEAVTRDA